MGQDDIKDRPDETEPLTSDTGAHSQGESSDDEDLDELDDDRDDDAREGGVNRRRSIN